MGETQREKQQWPPRRLWLTAVGAGAVVASPLVFLSFGGSLVWGILLYLPAIIVWLLLQNWEFAAVRERLEQEAPDALESRGINPDSWSFVRYPLLSILGDKALRRRLPWLAESRSRVHAIGYGPMIGFMVTVAALELFRARF